MWYYVLYPLFSILAEIALLRCDTQCTTWTYCWVQVAELLLGVTLLCGSGILQGGLKGQRAETQNIKLGMLVGELGIIAIISVI